MMVSWKGEEKIFKRDTYISHLSHMIHMNTCVRACAQACVCEFRQGLRTVLAVENMRG